jgi:magnesium chelatase accessory protein
MSALPALDWERDGQRWPHRERSRFVQAAGIRWHVQLWQGPAPDAPTALLLHGTGASTHSWRQVAPLLAGHMAVISLDLPGHAFTELPAEGSSSPLLSLPGMAGGVHAVLQALNLGADLIVGHSAGAAVAVRMALDALSRPRLIISLNGALLPLHGLAGQLFAPAARLMAGMSWIPRLFAHQARDRAVTERLLQSTGSHIDAEGTDLYAQLVASPSHAAAALGMMAQWDLDALSQRLPALRVPIDLIVATGDKTVRPQQAEQVLRLLQPSLKAMLTRFEGLGHLSHEEQPARTTERLLELYHRRLTPAA